jgi:threonine dehydrogenase-like Zn-dependent dehydrogenase
MLASRAEGSDSVFVTDKIDERLAISLKEGAAYAGNPLKEDIVKQIREREPAGLDVVFECCGQQEAVDQAVDILKPGGKIIVVGIPEFDRWSLNVENTRRREVMLQFIRRQVDCVEPALEMMNTGRIDVSNMVTHRFPFDRTKEAFDLVSEYRDGAMKVMIDF